jgi:hypothetical protein
MAAEESKTDAPAPTGAAPLVEDVTVVNPESQEAEGAPIPPTGTTTAELPAADAEAPAAAAAPAINFLPGPGDVLPNEPLPHDGHVEIVSRLNNLHLHDTSTC